MEIAKTCKEVQFRLSAAWKDGFNKHDVRYVTGDGNLGVKVSLTKDDKK